MGIPTSCARALPRAAMIATFVLATCTPFGATLRAADPLDSLAIVYYNALGQTLPYRLFLPPGYDEPGAEFPLVLFLHGTGERGDNNTSQVTSHINGLIDATQSERFASFLLAPQVPSGRGWSGGSGDQLSESMQLTTEIIALLETQYQIDPSRRYVTGLSMGGFGTFDVIGKRPDMFAAASPMSGGGNPSRAADMVDTPLWIFHGDEDGIVDVDASREMAIAITAAGGDPIYLEVDGHHDIWDPIYQDDINEFYPWMFEGVAPPLATFTYNANTGNVALDARLAPGGSILHFRINSFANFNLTEDIVIDGVTVSTFSDRLLVYDGSATNGFSTAVDLGNILAPGLDLYALGDTLREFSYFSLAAGRQRNFRLLIVIPEPGSAILLGCGVALVVLLRRR